MTSLAGSDVRLAELIGSMSLATDLGLGQPMEHVLRSCVLGLRIAEDIELEESERAVVYYVALLAWLGCELRPGESVVDLGSGSGMDVFLACAEVGPRGHVIGVDFTPEQLAKAQSLAAAAGVTQAEFRWARIERLPVDDDSDDCVISNGVINLSPEKQTVFMEAARVLRRGGRLAIADIVSEQQLKDSIVCDADLWASCIGGAAQEDGYRQAMEAAGLTIEDVKINPYEFISDRARNASAKYGVKSVSLLARKER